MGYSETTTKKKQRTGSSTRVRPWRSRGGDESTATWQARCERARTAALVAKLGWPEYPPPEGQKSGRRRKSGSPTRKRID
jgi:hypothetical protein